MLLSKRRKQCVNPNNGMLNIGTMTIIYYDLKHTQVVDIIRDFQVPMVILESRKDLRFQNNWVGKYVIFFY